MGSANLTVLIFIIYEEYSFKSVLNETNFALKTSGAPIRIDIRKTIPL